MMNPDRTSTAVAPHVLNPALAELKLRLQRVYEEAYPALSEIIHLVVDVEEARAWEMSSFPHLLLPDLVAAHVAKLNLVAPAGIRGAAGSGRRSVAPSLPQLAFA